MSKKTIHESLDELAVTALRIKRQRDALLKACRSAIYWMEKNGWDKPALAGTLRKPVRMVRAAIAKAVGGE